MTTLNISGGSGNKLLLNSNSLNKLFLNGSLTVGAGVTWDYAVIRNLEMDNAVGDAGSTDLIISAIDGNVLTVPNLPTYAGFYKETATWQLKNTSSNGQAILVTAIDDVAKTITVTSASGLSVSTRIALLNMNINQSFSGDQSTTPSIPASSVGGGWMDSATGGGPILPKDGSVYRWLFYGFGTGEQMGLATSYDMETWDVSNGGYPVLNVGEVPGATTRIFFSGNAIQVDGSLCCTAYTNLGLRIVFFDNDVSSFTFSDILGDGATLYPGGLVQIGSEYHMLVLDVSTGVEKREVQAWKADNINGPWSKYQNVIHGDIAPYGTAWDWITDAPTVHNDGHKIFGLFGGQTFSTSLGSGCGAGNREYCLLDFDVDTQVWSVSTKGPVHINPIDWPGAPWYYDHMGGCQSLFIDDDGTAYMGTTIKGYFATMMKLKNFSK